MMIGDFRGDLKKAFSVKRFKKYLIIIMPCWSTLVDEIYTPKMLSRSLTCLWNFNIFFKYSVSKMYEGSRLVSLSGN